MPDLAPFRGLTFQPDRVTPAACISPPYDVIDPEDHAKLLAHDPHNAVPLRRSIGFGNESCTKCHSEKAGPFVYNHDVYLIDGCQGCHVVHGSPNRHLLRHERQANLCYECHSGDVTPGSHSAPRFLNEKCEACHTAIHGSNTNEFFLEE